MKKIADDYLVLKMEEKQREKKKKVHPRKKANFLSHIFFCWELPIFVKGYRKQLTENDLYGPLENHKSKILGDKIEEAWNLEVKMHKTPSLWRVLTKVFGFEILLYGLILVPREIFALSQPLLIGKLMNYYTPNQTAISEEEAYLYSGLIVVTSFFAVTIGHCYYLGVQHLGMKMRVACSSLIYRKSLKLSQSTLVYTTVGQLVNLLSNDVSKFDFTLSKFHFLWMGPLEILVVTCLLYLELGPTAIIGVAILVLFIPIQMYFSKRISVYRMRTALQTDKRIRLMNEIIVGIKVIKMYTWEKSFSKLVKHVRKLEMKQIKSSSYFRAISTILQVFLSRTAVYSCILTYFLTGHTLNPKYVYVLSSFYEILRLGALIFFPLAMIFLGETITSVKRIQNFLTSPELDQTDKGTTVQKEISLNQVSVKWDVNSSDNILNDINFTVKPNSLVAVVGPVGSGKSTLLQVLLKEVPMIDGDFRINGTISYASQEPWLFGGSIKDNILFGEKLDQNKYEEIVRVCALESDFAQLPYGDRTLVGERGVMLSGGQKARINLARTVYKDADFYLLDDPLSAVDAHVGKQLFENCIKNYLKNKSRVLVTHQLQYLKGVDWIYLIENGTITANGTYQQLKASGNEFLNLLEGKHKEGNENEETALAKQNVNEKPKEVKENQMTGTIASKVYYTYLKSGGIVIIIMLVLLLQILVQIVGNGSDYFLSYWVNQEEEEISYGFLSSHQSLYVYSGLIAFLILISLSSSVSFFRFCLTASTNLHDKMFQKIVHMSMRFFNTNPSGRILNRFSQDIGLIDESLPISFGDTVGIVLNIIAIVVILSIINPWILIPTVTMFVLFYFFRNIYLSTSRNLKRVEGKTRSPIFSHLSTSLQGLATIRASNAQDNLKSEFENYQDIHSSSYYLFLACDCAFGFWLDFVCVIYVALVTLSFLFMGTETHGANVGLSITQSIMMTGMLQYGMKQWSQLENQMTSVERVVEYSELEPERDESTEIPPPSWPKDGEIEFKSVLFRYASEEQYVLKHISFHINPKEKIGIVGRTGAGKSSLISVFFRLADIEGQVFIDGVDTKTLTLQSLRSKISIIPQEPVLFSGTIRHNLDPFDEYQDSQLWEALEEVEMRSVVAELQSGLFSKVTESGSNFSVGQRQLFCLARALLRMNKILILDEATANVDPQTDELIQATIRRKFKDCTVLTIAHRLHTVLDCDRILVMANGRIVEFDSPAKLLENVDGAFYQLMQQSGKELPDHLNDKK